MYNRYKGNSGRPVRVEDEAGPRRAPGRQGPGSPAQRAQAAPTAQKQPPQSPAGRQPAAGRPFPLLGGSLEKLLPKNLLADFETEDLMLILVLYLMYRESGDKDLLIMMGAMFLL
ncbi:MAG: hypothetical protein Q4C13_08400 [Clostridia bacterium]|nr:hypothetical protein [Clostridia bacterium]